MDEETFIIMKTKTYSKEEKIKHKLERRATKLLNDIQDMIDGITYVGRRVKSKYNMLINDLADIIAIYFLIIDFQYKKAWNKIDNLDTIVREDYVDKKIFLWLQELYE